MDKDKIFQKNEKKSDDSDPESVYVSRKLIIRKMQKQIAKEVHDGRKSVSEYDSWSDLGKNLHLKYFYNQEHDFRRKLCSCVRANTTFN